jgi:hypothetical protein
MREIFKSGSVGRAPGNRCLYLEGDAKSRAPDFSVSGCLQRRYYNVY